MSRITTRSMSSQDSALPVFGVSLAEVLKRRPNPGGVPAFLYEMLNYLEVQEDVEIIVRSASPSSQVQKLKAIYDSDITINLASIDPVAVFGVVKLFVKEIPGGLVPFDVFSRLVRAIEIATEPDRFKMVKDALDYIPSENFRILKLMAAFIFRLQSRTAKSPKSDKPNRTFVSSLASVIFRPRVSKSHANVDESYIANKFVSYICDHHEFIFSAKKAQSISNDYMKHIKRMTTAQDEQNPKLSRIANQAGTEGKVNREPIVSAWEPPIKDPPRASTPTCAEDKSPAIKTLIKSTVKLLFEEPAHFCLELFGIRPRSSHNKYGVLGSAGLPLSDSGSLRSLMYTNTSKQKKNEQTTSYPNRPTESSIKLTEGSWSDSILINAEKRLSDERIKYNRPVDIANMNIQQLCDEKTSIKRELRDYDNAFMDKYGYEPTKADKEVLRPLYQRYKMIKNRLDSQPIKSENNVFLHHTQSQRPVVPPEDSILNRLLEEKKTLQIKLHEYQTEFYKKFGPDAKLVVDPSIKADYTRYKDLKSQIAQLEPEKTKKVTLFSALSSQSLKPDSLRGFESAM